MTPEPLLRPFIGISMYQDDYSKVKGLLPTPSYKDTIYSKDGKRVVLIYVLEGCIASPKQYRWISNIKLGLNDFLFVSFKHEDEFYISDDTETTSTLYTLNELSKAFQAPLIKYPKIMYPSDKKDLYKQLCWYGMRLIHQRCFTKEAILYVGILMNSVLKDKYSNKDLHKKALGAYKFIDENRENFSIRLSEKELKEAHSKGAKIKNQNQALYTKEKIDALLKKKNFIKANGKVNISLLAKAMNMTRKTISKYL